ncbi:MAG: hypothetical protein Q8927_07175 [Bacteroidota bacterium]|nr:hypothetical protein [Bacteroidota bacterium]MDP4257844.1 hypothetical protein [Bacteroidota bacterium]
MKITNLRSRVAPTLVLLALTCYSSAQTGSGYGSSPGYSPGANSPDRVDRTLQKSQQAINKAQNLIAVFEPYLLKAQLLYSEGKQLVRDVKGAAKTNGAGGQTGSQPNYGTGGSQPAGQSGSQPNYGTGGSQPAGQSGSQPNYGTGGQTVTQPNPEFYLPVNNPASVNQDASGNWGNQNNGLYGNCLDALTGTVLGMGEAADKPTSVDLLFFAPDDGQNTYYIMTPGFARNNSTATYMTQHTSDQVQQWKDVTESEVAMTRLTLGQFDQIRNNGQISSAVRNAQNYAGYYASVGQKLDGQVLAVKVQMDNREVYALIAVQKQMGTSGNNGYLKIRIKALGIDNNNNGIPDASNYIR